MARVDTVEKWKKKAGELQLKVTELEHTIASMQGEDTVQDKKLENLQKLHAQKVRALMNSIQELKKQLVVAKAQGKENNRSKLIEKLKTELAQQELSIQALRDLVGNDEACDEQIITYLNKGPPRIRPMSREEMRIQIRKLKGMIPAKTAKNKADKAVMDLEAMFQPGEDEERLLDPLQNEKIQELYTEIENYRIELRSKDHTIQSLRKQLDELQQKLHGVAVQDLESQINAPAPSADAGIHQAIQEAASAAGNSQGQLQELSIRLKASLKETEAVNKKLSEARAEIDRLQAEARRHEGENRHMQQESEQKLAALLGEIDTLRSQLDSQGGESGQMIAQLSEEVRLKTERISELETELEGVRKELDDVIGRASVRSLEQSYGPKDFEIEVLKAKLQQVTSGDSAAAASLAETEKYKQKTKDLMHRVAELEEEIEFLQQGQVEIQRQGAAISLARGRHVEHPAVPADSSQETEPLRQRIEDLERTNAQLTRELDTLQKLPVVSPEEVARPVESSDMRLVQQIKSVLENNRLQRRKIETRLAGLVQSTGASAQALSGIPAVYNPLNLANHSNNITVRLANKQTPH